MKRKTFEAWMKRKHPNKSLKRRNKRYVDESTQELASAWLSGWAHSEARAVPAVSALDSMVRAFYSTVLMESPKVRDILLRHFKDAPANAQAELMKLVINPNRKDRS